MADFVNTVPETQPVSGAALHPPARPPRPRPGLPIGDRRRALSAAAAPANEARDSDERVFLEMRRKVQSGELLSASTERLLFKMKFNGHLTVVVHHGRVVKSGYEEGYFRRKNDLGGFLFDS
jgi:hypothetical protein